MRLIKGVHVLFTGSSGKVTYGITVQDTGKPFDVNDSTLKKLGITGIVNSGFTEEEALQILDDLKQVENVQ